MLIDVCFSFQDFKEKFPLSEAVTTPLSTTITPSFPDNTDSGESEEELLKDELQNLCELMDHVNVDVSLREQVKSIISDPKELKLPFSSINIEAQNGFHSLPTSIPPVVTSLDTLTRCDSSLSDTKSLPVLSSSTEPQNYPVSFGDQVLSSSTTSDSSAYIHDQGSTNNVRLITYQDLMSSFDLVPLSVALPPFQLGETVSSPVELLGFPTNILSATQLSVFPLTNESKSILQKFLDYEANELLSVKPISVLETSSSKLYGYKCGDRHFFRVEISSQTVAVKAWDTGEHLGGLDVSRLFTLPEEFSSTIPCLRHRISMNALESPDVKTNYDNFIKSRIFLSEKVSGKVLKVHGKFINLPSGFSLLISYVYSMDGSINYNDLVLQNGYAILRGNKRSNDTIDSQIDNDANERILAKNWGLKSSGFRVVHQSAKVPFHSPRARQFDIFPTVVTSPEIIWCQVFHKDSEQLKRLLEDLNSFYQFTTNASYIPSVGELCAARFSQDNMFYRAEVIRVNNNGLIDVQFVDYGNKETLSFKELRHIKSCFVTLPKQALCFSLAGIAPYESSNWSLEATQLVKDIILEKCVSVKLVSEVRGKYFANIFHPSNPSVLLNDHLVEKGLAKRYNQMRGVNTMKSPPKIGRGSVFNHSMKFPTRFGNQTEHSASPDKSKHEKKIPLSTTSIKQFKTPSINSPVVSSDATSSETIHSPDETKRNFRQDYSNQKSNWVPMKRDNRSISEGSLTIDKSQKDQSRYDRRNVNHTDLQKRSGAFGEGAGVSPTFKRSQSNDETPQWSSFGRKVEGDRYQSSTNGINSSISLTSNWLSHLPKTNSGNKQNLHQNPRDKSMVTTKNHSTWKTSPRSSHVNKVSVPSMVSSDVTIPSLSLLSKEESRVIVVHIDNPDSFYVMPLTDISVQELVKMSENLQTDTHEPLLSASIGSYCVTKYIQDNCYSRAQVINAKSSQALVRFIDYGNTQTVSIQDLYQIDPKYCVLPMQAVHCSLYGVTYLPQSPGTWGHDVIKYFTGLVLNKEVELEVVVVKTGNLHAVRLTLDSSVNVAQMLIQNNFAVSSIANAVESPNVLGNPVSTFSSPPKINSSLSPCKSKLPIDPPLYSSLKLAVLPQNVEYTPVVISYVVSPDEIYIHLANEACSEIISKLILSSSDHNFLPFAGTVPLDAICCVKYAEDGNWYRARIVHIGLKNCKVHFIDFGNYATVLRNEISLCPDDIMSIPAQAIRCKLNGAFPNKLGSDWDPSTAQFLMKTFSGKVLLASVVHCSKHAEYSVKIVDTSGTADVDIAAELISKGYAQRNAQVVQQSPPTKDLPSPTRNSLMASAVTDSCQKFNTNVQKPSFSAVYIPPPILPTVHKKYKILITEVKSPSKCFGQTASDQFCEGLFNELSVAYRNPSKYAGFKPQIGAFCCSTFAEDGCWYRCKVLNIMPESVEVYYVDFGNTDSVPINELYHLDPKFASLPSQAVCFSIEDVLPQDGTVWSQQAIDELTNFINLKLVFAEVCSIDDSGTVTIKMFTDENMSQSVSEFLVRKGFATNVSALSVPNMDISASNERIVVVVSNINSPLSLSVQVASPDIQNSLLALQSAIDAYARSHAPSSNFFPKVGDFCCAIFPEDECWYRAVVTNETANTYNVHYIDFGNSAVVKQSDICLLTKEFTELPRVACHVSLVGTSSVPSSAFPLLTSLTEGKILGMKVVNSSVDPMQVELYDINSNDRESINTKLVSKSMHMSPRTVSPIQPVESPLSLPSMSLVLTNKFQALVVHIESVHEFYVQNTEEYNIKKLMLLMESINEYCQTAPSLASAPQVGLLCLAKFTDGEFFRAEVKEVLDGKCFVLFVDFGNFHTVHFIDMKPIKKELASLPAQAIKCSLIGVPELLPATATDAFQNYVCNIPMLCEVFCSSPLIVDLHRVNNPSSLSVRKSLTHDNFLPQESDIVNYSHDAANICVGSEMKVIITAVHSPQMFWLQLYNLATLTEFEKLLIDINAYCEKSSLLSSVPLLGQLCCAKFNEDGSWSRARIIGFDEKKKVNVLFIDFGNTQITDFTSLRPLLEEFLRIPAQGVCCSLNGYSSANNEETSYLFSSLVLNKQFHCISSSTTSDGRPKVDLYDLVSGTLVMQQFCK